MNLLLIVILAAQTPQSFVFGSTDGAPAEIERLTVPQSRAHTFIYLRNILLKNIGDKAIAKYQIAYRFEAGEADRMTTITPGEAEELDCALLPAAQVSVDVYPLPGSTANVPQQFTFFVLSVTFVDGTSWSADTDHIATAAPDFTRTKGRNITIGKLQELEIQAH